MPWCKGCGRNIRGGKTGLCNSCVKKGPKNHRWREEPADYSYHVRRLYGPPRGKCEICKRAKATDWHHKDGSKTNHKRSNLQALCHSCHSSLTQVEAWKKGSHG